MVRSRILVILGAVAVLSFGVGWIYSYRTPFEEVSICRWSSPLLAEARGILEIEDRFHGEVAKEVGHRHFSQRRLEAMRSILRIWPKNWPDRLLSSLAGVSEVLENRDVNPSELFGQLQLLDQSCRHLDHPQWFKSFVERINPRGSTTIGHVQTKEEAERISALMTLAEETQRDFERDEQLLCSSLRQKEKFERLARFFVGSCRAPAEIKTRRCTGREKQRLAQLLRAENETLALNNKKFKIKWGEPRRIRLKCET